MKILRREAGLLDLSLSECELAIIVNALNEVCNGPDAIEDWEFHIRTGVSRSDALLLLGSLSAAYPRR